MAHFDIAIQIAQHLTREIEFVLEKTVGMSWVVMDNNPLAHTAEFDQRAGVGHRRMPPANFLRILVVGILRFVQQHIYIATKIDQTPMDGLGFSIQLAQGGTEISLEKFIIWQIGDAAPPNLDLVTHRRTWMKRVFPIDLQIANLHEFFAQIIKL